MAKYRLYYEGDQTEVVEADRYLQDQKNTEWIDFYRGPSGAAKHVLRVKASKVWKIMLLSSAEDSS